MAVLKIMDSNFSAEFQQSQAYKSLQKVVDEEAEELERLRKVGQDAHIYLFLLFAVVFLRVFFFVLVLKRSIAMR